MLRSDILKIDRAELFLVPLRLREPFRSSAGTTHERRIVLLALHGDGLTGWSECVAGETPAYTPETTGTAWDVLVRWLLPAVVGRRHDDPSSVLAEAAWVRGHPMAKAAVEMAAWDLAARGAGIPLCEALGGSVRPVAAGLSLGLPDDEDALFRRVEEGLAEGYRRVKLKIEPGLDVEPLRRVRDRFPEAALAVDANGAYGLDDFGRLGELDDLALTMIEQPLPPDELQAHAELQARLRTPVCLDESIRSLPEARLALDLGSCRIVNLKPGRVGGHGPSRAIESLCRERGVPVWCGGMHESGIGRAHNVALATLAGFTLPGDLSASRRYWERDLVDPEWELRDGALVPRSEPGIGVEPDLGRVTALTTRRQTVG